MAKPFNKRLALLVLVPALIFGGLWIALPFVISSDLVRDALAREIAVWTGHRVQVGSSLQLRLTPSLRARLDDVTVLENGRENRTLLSVDTMEADISFWALFGGNLRFDNFLLVRPRLLVTQDADGRVSWLTGGGRFQEGAESGR
ncbi:MAG TPA: AsmA family protein, partial [Rhizobiaceae bacterium]|nr:AsmA family protein [Rhizobiaceae bacterium]